MEIKHGDSEVGQIKLEKWVSQRLAALARGWSQQRKITRGELEHEDNFSSLLKTVLVGFLLHWTPYFCGRVKGKDERGGKKRRKKRKERWRQLIYCSALSSFSKFKLGETWDGECYCDLEELHG